MQLYNYPDITINNQYIIYARKKADTFMKCFYSNSFIKLDSFYDSRIEVTLTESIEGFSTEDIYIQQKAMFIISYIYQKTIVKEKKKKIVVIVTRKFCLLQSYRLVESYVCYISQSYVFEDIYQNLLYSYSFIFIRNLFIYLFT